MILSHFLFAIQLHLDILILLMSKNLDKIGILLSTTCMLHCIVTPVLIASAPLLGGFFENPIIHGVLLLFVAPVAFSTLIKNEHRYVKAFGFIGLALLSFGFFNEVSVAGAFDFGSELHEHSKMHSVSIVGGAMLCIAHMVNLKLRFFHQL